LLDVGGNTGKITKAYSKNFREVVVLEPKRSIVKYGRSRRPHIKFVERGAESIPLPDKYFDKVVASASFHHFSDQDSALKEMK
jgi:ubiquinone/menaquinone biosynthesis C-methylase UbiE